MILPRRYFRFRLLLLELLLLELLLLELLLLQLLLKLLYRRWCAYIRASYYGMSNTMHLIKNLVGHLHTFPEKP